MKEQTEAAATLDFHSFDRDKTQEIDKEEFINNLMDWVQAQDKDKDDLLSLEEVEGAFPWIKTADRNKNGKISIPELLKAADEAFKNADADKSYNLTEKEFQNF